MKFLLPFLTMALASATKMQQLPDSVKVDSSLGNKIMSKARQLENGDDAVDFSWVADFSIKFQGCHHISQWNDEAEDDEDVRIATKRLVRFRLCPSNLCTASDAGGCESGYGDYVLDMNTYLTAYLESVEEYNEAKCEYLEATSGCGDDDDYCLYDYYVSNGMEEICAEENPYANNYDGQDEEEAFDPADYLECGEYEFDNGGRRLDNGDVEYYMGPYCAEQGGAIFMGLFTDDACTTFADDYAGKEIFYSMAGKDLPYGKSNLITMDCYSCVEPEVQFNYNGNDNDDEDYVNEMCEEIYAAAGKCESKLDAYNQYPNYNACSYIQGIQVIRKNGIIVSSGSKANKGASIFIGVFVVAFVLLSAYVYYLKTKLDRATINLAE